MKHDFKQVLVRMGNEQFFLVQLDLSLVQLSQGRVCGGGWVDHWVLSTPGTQFNQLLVQLSFGFDNIDTVAVEVSWLFIGEKHFILKKLIQLRFLRTRGILQFVETSKSYLVSCRDQQQLSCLKVLFAFQARLLSHSPIV